MLIFFKELTLDEGFEVIAKTKQDRLVNGRLVSAPSGKYLFEAVRGSGAPLKCWSCGLEANMFVLNKGQNDHVSKPTLDLYAGHDGVYTLMTRDHIIPRSLGGNDEVANLRIGCSPCNGARGNIMTSEDLVFMQDNQHLIKPNFVKKAKDEVIAENPVLADIAAKKRVKKVRSRHQARIRKKRAGIPLLEKSNG